MRFCIYAHEKFIYGPFVCLLSSVRLSSCLFCSPVEPIQTKRIDFSDLEIRQFYSDPRNLTHLQARGSTIPFIMGSIPASPSPFSHL